MAEFLAEFLSYKTSQQPLFNASDLNGDCDKSSSRITRELASILRPLFCLRYCLTFCFSCTVFLGKGSLFVLASSLLTHFLQKTLNVSLSIVSCVVWHSDVRFLNKRNFLPCVLASFVTIYERTILADAYYIIYKRKKFMKSEVSYGKELYNFIFWQRDVILVL